jgi:hypothetical protein
MMNSVPAHYQRFELDFGREWRALAVRIRSSEQVRQALQVLGFDRPYPTIFISGGAARMSDEDRNHTRDILEAIGRFAGERGAVIVDGGTESGIMQMLGDVRETCNRQFLLIGVAPMGKVSFPGFKNPHEEAVLEDSHSHFILVDGDEWGAESPTIVNLTDALSGEGKQPAVGILINGGKIAIQEVYLASIHTHKIPMLVLEGSGRAADAVSNVFRTGETSQKILQAIVRGGDIQLVGTSEGAEGMIKKLAHKFEQ